MIVNLRDDFARALAGQDPFAAVDALQGEVFRQVKGRRTLRFDFEDKRYFAKIHHGVGWGEIIKNLLSLKRPVLGAENEWCAIAHLKAIGVDTMTAVGFGSKGLNPARRHSFILTEALEDTVSLETVCASWPRQAPGVQQKWRLIEALGRIARAMHGAGMCHRDFYLCHFLLHDAEAFMAGEQCEPRLSLIDLHRALVRRRLGPRWVIKDIAGLMFSALHIGLTQRDFLRFARAYHAMPLRETLTGQRAFWEQVTRRAQALDAKLNS